MNRDRLSMVPARDTVQTAYAALSGAQSADPAQQVMAYAILFKEACQVLRLDVSQMLDAATRLTRHAEDTYSLEVHALRDYIKKELTK
jgi:hypothetical protein